MGRGRGSQVIGQNPAEVAVCVWGSVQGYNSLIQTAYLEVWGLPRTDAQALRKMLLP